MPVKTYKKKRGMRRKGLRHKYGRRRMVRSLRSNDVASCSESITFTAIQGGAPPTSTFPTGALNTTFTAFHNTDLSLSTFTRAPSVAANYQFFKIKYLELLVLPQVDTYTGQGGAASKAYFYYMLDKGNNLSFNLTNQNIKAMGAKAIALDEKPIKIRWRPAVVLANEIQTSTGTTSAQQYMVSPWLNCDTGGQISGFNPSNVCHHGIKFFAENNGATVNYTATLTAHFVFKKPMYNQVPAPGGEQVVS